MRRDYEKWSDDDLVRQIDIWKSWIRDAKEAKSAEIGRIQAEIDRRERQRSEIAN